MLGHRMKMFGIGTVAALAVGMWQVDTAKADHHGRRSHGRSYYNTSYYSSSSCGYRPVYVVAPRCYPARSTYYYSSNSYCAPPTTVGFSFSFGRSAYRDCDRRWDCDRDYRSVGRRGWGSSGYGRHYRR